MIVADADTYRANVVNIKRDLLDKTETERFDSIRYITLNTYVPIYIVAVYVGELFGFTPQILDYIDQLLRFYHIDKISNVVDTGDITRSDYEREI